ncbi:unnamed protein product [Linum tenue]|uniref:Serine/threonine-protein phosphatase 2A 55 kDa regulatory subunit B n=1 Tax=Linum tenue TaxID=586396 RepID=A0AAV0NUZ1_9ROSI|nr:unnamed protein product [Linum tenue]CAI0462180.1 unnamed protein product [Linum tenue]
MSAVDIISAIEFDKTGDHLATGDRGGRVVLFERTDTKDVCYSHGGSRRDLERMDYPITRHPEFRYKTEFQSHEPEVYLGQVLFIQLCDLYENDSIFDKFECCLSGDGSRVATGSYSNLFRVFGCSPGSTEATTLEASKNPMRRQVQTPSRPSRSLTTLTRVVRRGAESPGVDANGNSFDSATKLLHLAWHPTENSIACAAANSLYMYYA